MKKYLTILLLFTFPLITVAQLEKGTGKITAASFIDINTLSISADYGGFVSDNILLGGQLSLTHFGDAASVLSVSANP